jgi:hypothetical protein
MVNQTKDRTSLATKPFLPMRLQQMFFCLKGITTGIAHPQKKKAKVTVEYKCGTRVTTNKCTDVQKSWDEIGEIL